MVWSRRPRAEDREASAGVRGPGPAPERAGDEVLERSILSLGSDCAHRCATPSRRPTRTGWSRPTWTAVAALPAGHECAPTAPAHRSLRGRASTREPLEVAPRAAGAP